MGQIKLTTSLILIGLFTVAVLGFTINFATDNNSPIDISDDPEMSGLYTKTTGNMSQFEDGAEDTYQSIVGTTISPDAGTAQSAAPFAITPLNIVFVVKNVMKTGYIKIFGTGAGFAIFLNTFLAVIVFMLGLFLYKTLRGSPD